MPARLTLICHAATEAVRLGRFPADEDLDADGLAASARFAPPRAARWLSGPEPRVRRTALILADRAPEIESVLRDWDLGAWAGRTLGDVAAADPAGVEGWLADPARTPHGGEALDALFARVAGFMADAAGHGGGLVAVTHPAVVRAAIATALGAGAAAFWHIDVGPLTSVRLSHDGRRWVLQRIVPQNARPGDATDPDP